MKNLLFMITGITLAMTPSLSLGEGPPEAKSVQMLRVGGITPFEDAGELSGEVAAIDPVEGSIDIRNAFGKISKIHLDAAARSELKHIKRGDKVLLSLEVVATSLKEKRKGNGPQGSRGAQVTGKVVEVNRVDRSVDIRLQGGVDRINIEEDSKDRLKGIKPGDQIRVTLRMEATSIQPER